MSEFPLFYLQATGDFQRVTDLLGAAPWQIRKALSLAVKQTGKWANREGARGLAGHLNLPLSVLRKGLRLKITTKTKKGVTTANLWYGLNALALKWLGAKATDAGVTYQGTTIADGFKGPNGNFYQRVPGSAKRVMKRGPSEGKLRQPIQRLDHPINDAGLAYLETFQVRVGQTFSEQFHGALDQLLGKEAGTSAAILS